MIPLIIHSADYMQVNKLLKNGWSLLDVRNSTPTGFGFMYELIKY